MDKKLIDSIKNLGLNDKEAQIYLALLQLGQATAPGLAKTSRLKKPTAYVIIEQLVAKRFAVKLVSGKKKVFAAVSPEKCLKMAKTRVNQAENVLPELLALKKSFKEEKISVRYLEGIEGLHSAYSQIVKDLKKKPADKRLIAGFYARTGIQSEEIEAVFQEMNESFRKHAIKRRVLTVYNQEMLGKYLSAAMSKKYLVEVKAIKEEFYSSNVSIETYDDYIQIFSQRLMQIIVIEDADIAAAIRQIFDLVWTMVASDKEKYIGFESS